MAVVQSFLNMKLSAAFTIFFKPEQASMQNFAYKKSLCLVGVLRVQNQDCTVEDIFEEANNVCRPFLCIYNKTKKYKILTVLNLQNQRRRR